jgi:hypothetical protein
VQVSLTRLVGVTTLARDRMVGLEKVVPVVALFDLSEAVNRLCRERLGHLEALVAPLRAVGNVGMGRVAAATRAPSSFPPSRPAMSTKRVAGDADGGALPPTPSSRPRPI